MFVLLGGTYFEPTVLTNVSLEMLPMCDETFGPIVPIRRFDTEAEVIELANDTQYVSSCASSG